MKTVADAVTESRWGLLEILALLAAAVLQVAVVASLIGEARQFSASSATPSMTILQGR